MSGLVVDGLKVLAGGEQILSGIDLHVQRGEVHAVMGPNGSGKSTLAHVLMGRSGYEVLAGRVTLDGADLLAMTPFERAQAGLFLAMQYPTEVPGVSLLDMLEAATSASERRRRGGGEGSGGGGRGSPSANAVKAGAKEGAHIDLRGRIAGSEEGVADDPAEEGTHVDLRGRIAAEAAVLKVPETLLKRSVNVDFSGGEKKRGEALQLAILRPSFAVLDEIDSGLDIDALREVSRRIERAATEDGLGVLAITHYSRLLKELHADHVHILMRGRIAASGGPELAEELESDGYEHWAQPTEVAVSLGRLRRPSR